jgi:tetratricopeptide (TPR) repeat protein
MRALLDGRFHEAERLIPEALDPGQRAQRWDAVFAFRLQMYFLRREQGRLEEIEATITRSVFEYPTRSVFRCLLVHLACELGRTADARGGFEALATDRFASLPQDNDWLFNLSLLAEVAQYLGDVERARTLYELLSPYAGHAPTGGEVSLGAASRYLGVLASTLRRFDEAEAHLERALERNTVMGARPWVAYTLHDHGRVLLARDAPGDQEHASELLAQAAAICERTGMRALGARVSSAGRPPKTALVASGGVRGSSGFHREGEYWSIRFDGDEFRLRDSKGLRYLAQLLESPGREFLALDLIAAGSADGSARGSGATVEVGSDLSSGELGEILDPRAHAGYRRRLEELQGEIDEAERRSDPERASRARDEFDFIARELASAVGLGGRRRRGPSEAERARVNVTKAIRAALSRVGEHSPSLGRHLSSTIRTGTFCSYVPDPRLPEIWLL